MSIPTSSPVEVPVYETQFLPHTDDEESLWEVLEILKESKGRYLVKWGGIDPKTNKPWPDSWVPKEDCTDTLIAEWKFKKAKMEQQKKRKRKMDDSREYADSKGKKPSKSRSRSIIASSPATLKGTKLPTSVPIVEIDSKKRKLSFPMPVKADTEDTDVDDGPTRKKRRTTVASSPTRITRFSPSKRTKRSSPDSASEDDRHIHTSKKQPSYRAQSDRSQPPPIVKPVHTKQKEKRNADAEEKNIRSRQHGRAVSLDVDDPTEPIKTEDPESDYVDIEPVQFIPSATSAPHNWTIVPETQPSQSPAESHIPSPADDPKHFVQPAKVNGSNVSTSKMVPQQLRPVPLLSPSIFKEHVSKTSIVPASQDSPIDDFSAPADELQSHRKSGSMTSSSPIPQRRKQPSYSQRQEEEESSSEAENNLQPDDDIEEFKEASEDIAIRNRRHSQAEETASRGNGRKHRKRLLSEVLSGPENQNISDDYGSLDYVHSRSTSKSRSSVTSARLAKKSSVRSESPSDSEFSNSKIRADDAYSDNGRGYGDENVFRNDSIRPEDAADGSPFPNATGRSSTDVNVPFIQQRDPTASITSPVRQLDGALGLLNRKSAEIQELEEILENRTAHIVQLETREREHLTMISDLHRRCELLERALNSTKSPHGNAPQSQQESLAEPSEFAEVATLLEKVSQLESTVFHLNNDKNDVHEAYARASARFEEIQNENRTLSRDNDSLRQQANAGVKQARLLWETRVNTLEKELTQMRGMIDILTEQIRRTENVRESHALLPLARQEKREVEQELEVFKDRFEALGHENTRLRLEVKKWEDEALARRQKEQAEEEQKRQEQLHADELVFLCPWLDSENRRCTKLFASRNDLRAHLYETGHL